MLQQHEEGDGAIRATDNDASLARLSAVNKGYLKDAYIQHFVPRARFQPSRPPLINIGTYIRSEGIDKLVDAWIRNCAAAQTSHQIVSLGAGSDTRFWRFCVRRMRPFHLDSGLFDNTDRMSEVKANWRNTSN